MTLEQNKQYSQGDEQKYIIAFFDDFTGTLCSIGENDGVTFSNALRLIELGWCADLFEPSIKCVDKLKKLHSGNNRVKIHECAIGSATGKVLFNESGSLISDEDHSLVSTVIPSEKNRWGKEMIWTEYPVNIYRWDDFFKAGHSYMPHPKFDFITIDAEGSDVNVLKQIKLYDTKLLCIEHNSIPETRAEILKYCATFGMTKILYENGENLLICRP